MGAIEPIYQRLDVHLDYTHGESFYNPMLSDVVESLLLKGIAWESQGAVVVFFCENGEVADGPPQPIPEGADEKKKPIPPSIIRSGHGAFTYMTSDLATIRYRMEQWSPDTILYVVDFRQALHFRNLFAIARRWKYTGLHLEHVSFGSVLGEDRKPIKTREGQSIELADLLDEAVARAGQVYEQNRRERREMGQEVPELSADELQQVKEAVGIGAVKYADLCQNRTSDYVFSWPKMLAMSGNTGTYMQYAFARNRAIFRKGSEEVIAYRKDPPLPVFEKPEERALALKLLQLGQGLATAAAELQPHAITSYLFELAGLFSTFYDKCPVLKAETPELRRSRLLLTDLTGRVIHLGLSLLGIRTIERM
jgi:arginyl-tRNA synthetase